LPSSAETKWRSVSENLTKQAEGVKGFAGNCCHLAYSKVGPFEVEDWVLDLIQKGNLPMICSFDWAERSEQNAIPLNEDLNTSVFPLISTPLFLYTVLSQRQVLTTLLKSGKNF